MEKVKRRDLRAFRPRDERLEDRLVMSGKNSVAAEVQALLKATPGAAPVRPNTPVLPLESASTTASFVDPTDVIIGGNNQALGQKDFLAPFVTLSSKTGLIKIGSSTTIQDHARLIANPRHQSGLTGILVGDNVVVGDGAVIDGPSAIGTIGGAATSIGANAVIDGAIIQPGAFVGALARVGPGVTVPTGFRVLPGANVTTNAQASDPTLGLVVKVTPTDAIASAAPKLVASNAALAAGYANVYQGNSATGGSASSGPIPAPISASGSTVFFGALSTVLGASSEPGSKLVSFEPASGTPLFLQTATAFSSLASNASFNFPDRVIGAVTFNEDSGRVAMASGKGVSIRADEGQPITIGSIAHLGNNVSIHSPGGGVQSTTTTTVVTTTIPKVGAPTTTTTSTSVTTMAAPTATAGTTTATTSGTNAQGVAFTGTTTTTVAITTTNIGTITIGNSFRALDGAVILGGPAAPTVIGDDVTVGLGAVVGTSTIGSGSVIGNRSYIAGSTIPAGSIVPPGSIIINNQIVGSVQS